MAKSKTIDIKMEWHKATEAPKKPDRAAYYR